MIGWRENYVFKLTSGQIVAIYQDVTEKKKGELITKENEARFKAILDESQDGIALTDEKGNIIEWNRGMERIFMERKPQMEKYLICMPIPLLIKTFLLIQKF